MRFNGCIIATILSAGSLAQPSARAAELGGPPVRAMSTVEASAHAVWSTRAGLNVAALQCQFSPYLATVRNYNDLLKQHSVELAKAYKTMEGHFRRYDGAQGPRNFDVFVTRMYNSFSALDAQRSFCETAGELGREALALTPGSFSGFAAGATQRLRKSLVARPDPFRIVSLGYLPIPKIPDPCLDRKGRPVKRCQL